MATSSARPSYTREDVLALLDGDSDPEVAEEDLDDIFYPGSDEEGFVLEERGSEPTDSDQEDPEDNPGDLYR